MFSQKLKQKLSEQGFAYLFKEVWYNLDSKSANPVNLQRWIIEQLTASKRLIYSDAYAKIPCFKTKNQDQIILRATEWVYNHIEYCGDNLEKKGKLKRMEYWQTWDETIILGNGDCEDQTILILAIAWFNGVKNPLQLRVCAGDVDYGSGTTGHCWLEYQASTMDWYIFDSAYWYDNSPIPQRRKAYEMTKYKRKWWSFAPLIN